MIPIPHKILLQANVARREVHHPRPARRVKRPRRGKRPPAPYASKYQDYRPSRKRRPPPVRNHNDYEQGADEDFEYDDRPYKEFEDFLGEQPGYSSRGKPSRGRQRDEDTAYTENTGFFAKRPRPLRNGRPSTKLYSAAIALPPRSNYRDEADYDEEEEEYDYSRENYDRDNYSDRGRYRDEDEEEEDGYFLRDRYRDWDPDNVYHDRKYTTKQDKFRRAAFEKPKSKNHRQVGSERNQKPRLSTHPDSPQRSHKNEQKVRTQDELKPYHNNYNEERKLHQNNFQEDRKVFQNNYHEQRTPFQNNYQEERKNKVHNSAPNKFQEEDAAIPHFQERKPYQNNYDKNRWKTIVQMEDEMQWKEPQFEQSTRIEPTRREQINFGDQSRWRNPASLGIGKLFSKDTNFHEADSWKEPDIITKQNAERWENEQRKDNRESMKEDSEGWVKEHSVGYGIEIDGGGRKKKAENHEPDVVYGQSGYSKPRVPDLGYGQGMELVDDKVTGWQVYLR